MIRQVLYSWGKLYFPWGIEDISACVVAPGLSIADPLSGRWEFVEIVPGYNTGFDSAIFRYVPADYSFGPAWFGPTGRVLDNGKICFDDPELPGIVHGLAPEPLRYNYGPETQPVNAAALQDDFLRVDFVLRQLEMHIKWSRNYEEANVLRHLKEALGFP